jgi:hypothetical protein
VTPISAGIGRILIRISGSAFHAARRLLDKDNSKPAGQGTAIDEDGIAVAALTCWLIRPWMG